MKKLLLIFLAIAPLLVLGQVGKTYHVNTKILNFRTEPNTKSEIIDKLEIYDNVVIVNDTVSSGWYQVDFEGTTGYVSAPSLKKGKCQISYYIVRTGAVCKDGTHSTATGRGACSHHGGVARWKTKQKKSVNIIDD